MEPIRVIEVKESIFADNNADAEKLRAQLKRQGTFLLNVMSSPGAGKTSTLQKTIGALDGELLALFEQSRAWEAVLKPR